MSKNKDKNLLEDAEYENGAGVRRALSVCWHENFGLFNISFYEESEKDLVFAEDFDLRTAIKLRDRLKLGIKTAQGA